MPSAVARAITFKPAMCSVGKSSDQASPGTAPRYLWAALVEAINAAVEIATEFASPVEPEVLTTKHVSAETNLIWVAAVASAGPSPVIASAIFS